MLEALVDEARGDDPAIITSNFGGRRGEVGRARLLTSRAALGSALLVPPPPFDVLAALALANVGYADVALPEALAILLEAARVLAAAAIAQLPHALLERVGAPQQRVDDGVRPDSVLWCVCGER